MLFEWVSARWHVVFALYGQLLPCPPKLHMDDWYEIHHQVVGSVAELYRSPVHFEAAFDDEDVTVELLRPLLGNDTLWASMR